MVRLTQAIRRQQPTNCLSVFYHFVGLALKWLKYFLVKSFQCSVTFHIEISHLTCRGNQTAGFYIIIIIIIIFIIIIISLFILG